MGTGWGAGDSPPQWIEIDLGTVRSINDINLVVDQFPEGDTHHRVLLAGTDGDIAVAAEFEEHTAPGDVLAFHPPASLEAR